MSFGGGSSTTTTANEPYAPAQPALGQIINEAQNIYAAGPQYVAPTEQTLEGISQAESTARLASQQIADTISGQYSNPFLSPIIASAADDIYTNVAAQFSGAGRTPTSALAQQQVIGQVANRALPLAFQASENERNRQLQTARAVPSLTAVGGTLEDIQARQLGAPLQSLQQYANIINPIARGGTMTTSTLPQANRLGTAAGGALTGAALGNQLFTSGIGGYSGAAVGGVLGALGGLL